MTKQEALDAIIEALSSSNPDDLETTDEGELIVYTGIHRMEDGTYREKL
jgi:20S proteasome alpha/beta subunit